MSLGSATEFVQITEAERCNAMPMELSLEDSLRQVDFNANIVMPFRVNDTCDRELFVALDPNEYALRDTRKSTFGLDPSVGFPHVTLPRWSKPELQLTSSARLKLAHGEHVALLAPNWTSLTAAFKAKLGANIHDNALSSQSYCGLSFDEFLLDSQLTLHIEQRFLLSMPNPPVGGFLVSVTRGTFFQ